MKGSPVDLRPPVATMIARLASELPDEQHDEAFAFEPKLDGWRYLALHRLDGRVELRSRRHRRLTAYFPEVVAAVGEQLPDWDRGGRRARGVPGRAV
jgi:ATP-dependent DNA ligase